MEDSEWFMITAEYFGLLFVWGFALWAVASAVRMVAATIDNVKQDRLIREARNCSCGGAIRSGEMIPRRLLEIAKNPTDELLATLTDGERARVERTRKALTSPVSHAR